MFKIVYTLGNHRYDNTICFSSLKEMRAWYDDKDKDNTNITDMIFYRKIGGVWMDYLPEWLWD